MESLGLEIGVCFIPSRDRGCCNGVGALGKANLELKRKQEAAGDEHVSLII